MKVEKISPKQLNKTGNLQQANHSIKNIQHPYNLLLMRKISDASETHQTKIKVCIARHALRKIMRNEAT